MSTLTVEFKFEIDELVFIKGAQHTQGSKPTQFLVVEQLARRCSGGTQLCYILDNCKDTKAEIALTRDEPPYRPASDAWLAERIRFRQAEQDAADRIWRESLAKREREPKESPETAE